MAEKFKYMKAVRFCKNNRIRKEVKPLSAYKCKITESDCSIHNCPIETAANKEA